MKIIEVWTKVKSIEVSFIGGAIIFAFRTEHCAQHCGSWLKANPAFVVSGGSAAWSC